MTISIDFGTSNTVVACWDAATQKAEAVRLPLSSQLGDVPVVPSLVYLKDLDADGAIVGQAVRDRGLDVASDRRFFRSFKRGIGADVGAVDVDGINGETVSFERVGELFLQNVLKSVRAVSLETESLVLTVPVESFEVYRQWLGKVCAEAGVDRVRILDEPTAAALGYGATDAKNLLVVDFGGGTLDLSLVKLDRGAGDRKPLGFILKWGAKSFAEESGQKVEAAQVLAKSGRDLGGTDIDNWLVDYFAEKQGLDKNALTTRLAERLKIQLSEKEAATEVYFDEENFESVELSLDRETFEQVLRDRDFFGQLDRTLETVLQQAKRHDLEAREIDAVLLVGGSSQIPAVQRWVERHFPAEKIRSDRPLDAIALGALKLEDGIEVKDFLQHGYGIRFWDRRSQAHRWHPIVPSGQPYPTRDPIVITLGASMENQPKIELILGELGDRESETEIFFDGDRLIARTIDTGEAPVKPLNDSEAGRVLAELDPPGVPGSDRIRVEFRIDDKRFLRVSVEDLLRQRTLIDDRPAIELN